MSDTSSKTEAFVRQLTENQNRLYGYVFSLLGDHSRAADVVQETNLVLWRKIDEFDSDKPFLPWAFAIARFQVLAHLRDQKRDRLLFDAELVEVLADEAERQAGRLELTREALRDCLQQLAPGNRDLIESRYIKANPVADIAKSTGRKLSAVKMALMRSRRQLALCVRERTTS
jgi:RNA polymerase sigma-70 factor (ECF subfamily)